VTSSDQTVRLELPSGAWAELSAVVTFGARRRVALALRTYQDPDADAEAASVAPADVVAALVLSWSYSAPITREGCDELPARDFDAIFDGAADVFAKGTRPLDPPMPESSPRTPPALP
jgi:hypothetical protein